MMSVLFYLYAAMVMAGALGVVFSTNIVRTAIQLLFTLLGVAGLYFLLQAEFLAAMQLVVYVGGTLVLIIFGVMLTARSSMQVYSASKLEKLMAGILGAIMLMTLTVAFMHGKFPSHPQSDDLTGGDTQTLESQNPPLSLPRKEGGEMVRVATDIRGVGGEDKINSPSLGGGVLHDSTPLADGAGMVSQMPSSLSGTDPYSVNKLGQALLGDFLVPFELTSLLLLAVMIGAAFLAKHRVEHKEMR